MTESKLITLPIENVILVVLPEGYKDPFIAKTYIDEDGHTYDTNPQWVEWSGTFPNNTIDLPPGNWQLIGRLSKLRGDDIAGLIEPVKVFDYTAHYWNYNEEEYQPIMPEQSLESAILAEGWYFENPYGTNTLYYTDKFTGEKKVRVDWAELQSRVLCRERALILRRV